MELTWVEHKQTHSAVYKLLLKHALNSLIFFQALLLCIKLATRIPVFIFWLCCVNKTFILPIWYLLYCQKFHLLEFRGCFSTPSTPYFAAPACISAVGPMFVIFHFSWTYCYIYVCLESPTKMTFNYGMSHKL